MILEREHLTPRNLLLVAGGVTLIGATFFLYPKLTVRYQHWKHRGTIDQVQKFTAERDVPNALLAIKTALGEEPSNPIVWRMAADFAEQIGNAEAVQMRQQLVALEPDVAAHRLALARTALYFKDTLTARQALESIPERERATTEFRQTAAALAIATDHPQEAAALLTVAIAATPGDAQLRLQRASLYLRHGAPAVAAGALGEMRALADHGETRRPALRELALAALRSRDYAAALQYAEELVSIPSAPLVDRLLRANILLAQGNVALTSLLPPLQARAVANPMEIPELAGWMSAMKQTAAAAEWLNSLTPEMQSIPPIAAARANCLMAVGEWEQARVAIANGAYGRVPPETVQLAFAARVLRDHDRPALQRATWEEAIRLTSADLAGLRVLHRLALEWKWSTELNAVLLTIAEKHPNQTWAFQALAERYARALDTANLKSLYAAWREAEPASAFVEGNAIFLQLLTEPSKLPSQAKTRAAELYQAAPQNAFAATTHAFALWQLGRTKDAAAVIAQLPELDRRAPNRALYTALILNGAGRKAEAAEYLSLVRLPKLFPEERDLYQSLASAPGPAAKPKAKT